MREQVAPTVGATTPEQAEAVLRETAQFYIALDEAGVVRSWNPAASRVFGYSAGQAVGRSLEELVIGPSSRGAHRSGIAAFVRTGHGRGIDAPVVVQAVRADGTCVPVELTIWAQRTASGYLFHALGSDLSERQAHEQVLRLLAEHRRQLLHVDRPRDVQDLLVDTVLRTTGCDAAWLYVPADREPPCLLRVAEAVRTPLAPTVPDLPASADVPPALVASTLGSAADPAALQAALEDGFPTVAVEPVRRADELVALLALGWRSAQEPLSTGSRELLSLLAAEAGLVMQRLQMQEQLEAAAHTDSLTGLANRRAFDRALEREVGRAAREGTDLSLVLLDLDDFKAYNDTFGHPAGDDLLRRTTADWGAAVRLPDLLARLGGDEFALLLPGAGAQAAATAVERLEAVTAAGTSFSAGVAAVRPGEGTSALMARADQALYRSKRRRDR